MLNTTSFFAKGQGYYFRQKLFLLDSIYNKADIGIGIADPIVRIEVTETGISTIISVAANEECLLLICLTNTKVKKQRPDLYFNLIQSNYSAKADIGMGIADPNGRIEETETGSSTISSAAANEERPQCRAS